MKYRKLGKSGIDVSVIGLGTWALGNDFFGEVDVNRGIDAIHEAIDKGVNLIDTAPGYGLNYEAETAVGKAIKGKRDKVVISTKCGIHRIMGEYVHCLSPDVLRQEVENSLKRLGTDYIDVLFIHWPDYNFGIEGGLEVLAELKKAGKIRAAGVSNFSLDEVKTAVEIADIDCIQPPCNLLDRSYIENGVMPFCAENNIGIMTYGSLGGGILTGAFKELPKVGGKELRGVFYKGFDEKNWDKTSALLDVLREVADARGVSVGEVSINWTLAQPGVTTALLGSTNPKNVDRNVLAAEWELTKEELDFINKRYSEIF